MRKRILLSFAFLLVAFTALTFLTNRSHYTHNEKKVYNTLSSKSENENTVDTTIPVNSPTLEVNDTLTDIANFIAGINTFKTKLCNELIKDSAWIKYARKTDGNWEKLDTTRYEAMEGWVTSQLSSTETEAYNLFYPFSGPDFLNADIFFPKADTVTMMGLEPVGSLPKLGEESFKDSLYKYVSTIKLSLNDILNLSFFKTKDMFTELRSSELNGATHLLLWFAARRGYNISSVKHIALDFTGRVITKDDGDTAYAKSNVKGIEIACVNQSRNKVIRYFSTDISNHGFKKNERLNNFLQAYHFKNTLVKSASYLMHAANFTKIKNIILDKTTNLLQDDTGVPYRYLTGENWQLTLFGTYDRPIHLFAKNYQEDLKQAYDSLETKPLSFGIGYKYRKNESTWMLISRKGEDKLTAKQSL